AACVRDVDRADVDAADVRGVVVDEAEQLELGLERRIDLFAPLASQAAAQIAVARVQVAADADRPQVVEPRVAAGLRPAHEEVARAVAQDEVRDHLLPRAVAFHLATRPELAVGGDERLELWAGHEIGADAAPAGIGHQDVPRHDQHELVVAHGVSRSSRARRARASSSRITSASAPSKVNQSIHVWSALRRATRRSAMASWLVATIPAPISGSPLARRVMSAQPDAASRL